MSGCQSVIIPTANSLDHASNTLDSLEKLEAPPHETILVQNALPDDSRYRDFNRYTDFANHYKDIGLKIFFESTPGLLSGRHRGAAEATGDLLIFVDDDVTFASDWLSELSGVFDNPKIALAGGPSVPVFAYEPPQWLKNCWQSTPCGGRQMAQLSLLQLDTNDTIDVDPDLVWGLNYAIRRDALNTLGGFHPDCVPASLQHFQGDGETGLSQKITEAGRRAVYNPNAIVHHHIGPERMTKSYFDQRSFYQGVCNSYTEIRSGTDPTPLPDTEGSDRSFPPLQWARRLKRSLRPSVAQDDLPARFFRAYVRGFNFHRACVRSSPRLLQWVRQETYFDYHYPTLEPNFSPAPREVHDPADR
ncbi:GT2 family glycosyltransferase [Rhodopirellula rubra]|uniref:GT2 family glycosyltransferase n=1 Tax=Aporhodopirellula rubra TaxID=980271 RepID=A0A7W5H2K7_9BACT|nr:glycosyltransferase family 2 protein [Aporhodopirellula rubra]MBB3204277.1 GT2 family glycosyltransferase [Aporhodopirellula rubra]